MRVLVLLLFLFCSCTCFSAVLQDSSGEKQEQLKYDREPAPAPLDFDQEKLNSLKEEPTFDYTEKPVEDSWWSQFKRYIRLQWERFISWIFGPYEMNTFWTIVIEIIPYLILAGIFFFVLWLFIRLNPGNSILSTTETGSVYLSAEEEIIESQDIDQLIKNAISEEKYRLAIRYYYLLILQKLKEKNLIDYKFSKTDEEYLAEIKPRPLYEKFRQLTRIYDYIWYGSLGTSKENFTKAEKEFQQMQQLIKEEDEQKL